MNPRSAACAWAAVDGAKVSIVVRRRFSLEMNGVRLTVRVSDTDSDTVGI